MSRNMLPLLTLEVHERLRDAARLGQSPVEISLDLGRTVVDVRVDQTGWSSREGHYAWIERCKARTIYYPRDGQFVPVSRFGTALIKLVPTQWGAPTFEIDGVKMLPTSKVSPVQDAQRKVDLIAPRGKVILDTRGGLGYFAAWCLKKGASKVLSFEKSPDVLWVRALNPWSPAKDARLSLVLDITI